MYRDIIKYSLVSSVLPRLPVERKNAEPIMLRTQINVLLNAPFGTGKTELLDMIHRRGLGVKMTYWTEVAFLGSIRRNGEFIPPQTIRGAGSTILIDEFQAIPNILKRPLLNLMEEQETDRSLNFQIPKEIDPFHYESEFWRVFATGGYFIISMRASYIVATSKLLKSHTDRMLQSRCIQVNVQVDYEDLKRGLLNLKLDDVQEIREELHEKNKNYWKKLTERQYSSILNYVIEQLKAERIPANYGYRVTADLIRIMNILGLLGEDTDKAYNYLHFILSGIKGSKFSPIEYEILSILEKPLTLKEICSKIQLSKESTIALLKRLNDKGLIFRKGSKYIRR